jgi:CheY-like chemotaxis protein
LIINARDAMLAGGTVTVSAENRQIGDDEVPGLEAGDYVRLAVADTGTGISPENLQKVMEPFFTTKDVGKGSGLGLSMVYGFARQSNGAFLIESEVGQGTTAELWLPRGSTSGFTKSDTASEETVSADIGTLRILLVDDHAEVRSTTAAVLTDSGHTVFEAENGADALRMLKEEECACDLLISDYAMPHLSGTEFLAEARQLCPDIPALIITGYAEAEAIADRPQGVEILLKPFTPNALEAALGRICDRMAASL